jgi:hypothetical protein
MESIIINDWSDMSIRDAVMDQHGDSPEPFYGENQDGEKIAIHVAHNGIVLVTYQHNGWIRNNYYYYGEDRCEEIFDGKWK